ncbi:MAG: hypothetical protein IJL31_00680 [Oscillospiraceae bacterium]|nr:hypothetical protein [Oscillospiraceae bacterium]
MSGQTEKIEWYYISDADYQKLLDTGGWSNSTNPFEEADFNETFSSLGGYRFARKHEIDGDELRWAALNDIVIGSTAFAESNQTGVVLQ